MRYASRLPVNQDGKTVFDSVVEFVQSNTSRPEVVKVVHAAIMAEARGEFKAWRYASPDYQRMFAEWTAALDRLDRGFEEVVREYDWAIKYVFFRTAFGGNISSAKARFSNFLYHDISERGIYNRLLKRGAVLCFALPDDIRNARMNPPPTRAEFRSRLIKALMRRKDNQTIQFPRDWGYFIGPTRSTAIPDPLERTNEAAENVLKNVEEHGVKKIPPNTPPASVDPEADFILPQEWE